MLGVVGVESFEWTFAAKLVHSMINRFPSGNMEKPSISRWIGNDETRLEQPPQAVQSNATSAPAPRLGGLESTLEMRPSAL